MRYVPTAVCLSLIAILVAACGASPTPTPPPAQQEGAARTTQSAPDLQVDVIGFSLLDITIPTGATIEWSNQHFAPHTITSGIPGESDGVFDSGTLQEDDSYAVTFDSAGSFSYYCAIHPDSMRATITVSDGARYSTSGGSSAGDDGELGY